MTSASQVMSARVSVGPPLDGVVQAAPAVERQPWLLHLWVLLYLAAIYIRPSELIPSLAGVPILDYLTLGVGGAAALSLLLNPRKFWDEPHDKAFLCFWLALLLSNPAWGWLEGGIQAFTEFAPVAACYFFIRLGVRSTDQIRSFTRVFVGLNLFLAANGLLQIFAGVGIGQVAAMETREGVRIQGTGIFNDPNDLGLTLVMTVPFAIHSAFGKGVRWFGRPFGFISLTILLLACYYTNSRGTILGLGGAFAVYAYRRHGFFLASTLVAMGLALLVVLGPSRMAAVTSEEASAQGRIQAWVAGYQAFFERPITGIGFRRFDDYYGLLAHNSFVHVLAEIGLLGMIPFVAVFYWTLQVFFASSSKDPPNPAVSRLRSALAASAVGMLVCISFLSRQYVIVPFIPVALAASYASSTVSGRMRAGTFIGSSIKVLAATAGVMVGFYLIARLLANYG